MKVVILAGGYGTRLAEYTNVIPKPMVPVGGKPILWHIMSRYSAFGFNDFVIALGYKGEVIKEYFLNYYSLNADFTVDLGDGSIEHHESDHVDWKVTLKDTGRKSMTGGRLGRLRGQLSGGTFMMTYGDGVADIDISALLDFHYSHGRMVTVTAVHPAARFGELDMTDSVVRSFSEKPQIDRGWINGGFFVMEPGFLELIRDDATVLEKEPLETAARKGELMAYRHDRFWQCMDTKRDHDLLERLWAEGQAPWSVD